MKVVSLFSGCGGLDLGFKRAGFNVLWANEYDSTIVETYSINHPNTFLETSDIRTINESMIPDCDGIIGGPPCQAWSEGGKCLGLNDERGKVFLDYIRIVSCKRPKFFLIENVKGLLSEKHIRTFYSFLSILERAGYIVDYSVLNAADFKIPQDRVRVFVVGIRKDINRKFLFPKATTESFITLRKAIGDITEQPKVYLDDFVNQNYTNWLNHDVYTGPYDEKYMSRNRVRSWNEISFTIQALAKNAPIHPQAPKMVYISPNKRVFVSGKEFLYRRLSIRECARIQSFPDKFRFIYSDIKNGYKMVGNAVPPRLAYVLANAILNSCFI
ncbi:MAG: DNA cytosine methyltransferase [Bacteroidales bacterium]